MSDGQQAPRYRAVKLKRAAQAGFLRAGIEDTTVGRLTPVATPALARYLARVLSDMDRGEPLPPPGEQHRPKRFQLVHDATGLSRGVTVTYIHLMAGRPMASCQDEELGERIAKILNWVGYPMDDRGSEAFTLEPRVPSVGSLEDGDQSDLPTASFQEAASGHRLGLLALLLVLVVPTAVAAASLVIFFGWAFAIVGTLGFLGLLALARHGLQD